MIFKYDNSIFKYDNSIFKYENSIFKYVNSIFFAVAGIKRHRTDLIRALLLYNQIVYCKSLFYLNFTFV